MEGDTKYWLALAWTKGVKRADIIRTLKTAGPAQLFEGRLEGDERTTCAPVLQAIKKFDGWESVERELELAQKHDVRLIAFNDPEYPPLLREIYDPPLLLYAKGGFRFRGMEETVAVVGTRRPTHYGTRLSETISRDLAYAGAVIVSGMARGCDAAAHTGALSSGGVTVAVLGTGVDVAYPVDNRRLYEAIAENGVILSELPISTPPRPYNFPRRNRIISGISRGVLVVEAPMKSGAMITARIALEDNRDVFAVPGPVTSHKSRGSNRLIKDGAQVVEDAGDIIDALGITPVGDITRAQEKEGGRMPDGEEGQILRLLGRDPMHIDEIIERTGLGPARVSGLLVEMELKGLLLQRPGKSFVKKF